ncbi:MAG: hypothetical protein AB9M60_20975 [Leptothrix sp. (in: b-proteobacteria)]
MPLASQAVSATLAAGAVLAVVVDVVVEPVLVELLVVVVPVVVPLAVEPVVVVPVVPLVVELVVVDPVVVPAVVPVVPVVVVEVPPLAEVVVVPEPLPFWLTTEPLGVIVLPLRVQVPRLTCQRRPSASTVVCTSLASAATALVPVAALLSELPPPQAVRVPVMAMLARVRIVRNGVLFFM